jgi:molybdate transport system permease protein
MIAGSIPGKTQTISIAIYEAVQAGQDSVANFLVLLASLVCVCILAASGKFLQQQF